MHHCVNKALDLSLGYEILAVRQITGALLHALLCSVPYCVYELVPWFQNIRAHTGDPAAPLPPQHSLTRTTHGPGPKELFSALLEKFPIKKALSFCPTQLVV